MSHPNTPRHTLYTALVANFLFPLHEKLKKHNTVALRKQMEQSQWWTPEQLRAFQFDRLKALLIDAGQNVPYYRNMFRTFAVRS